MFSRLLPLIKKEFLSIWKDPKSRMLILVPPILQLLIFANAITMEVKNIDMAVLDRNNTQESRELLSRFENSKWFRKIVYVKNEKEIKKKIDTQQVQIALEISNDFAASIKAQKPVSMQIIVDGRQTNSASIAGAYASQIINSYSREVSPPGGSVINAVIRNWFNPNLEYQWYVLVTLVTLLALVVTLLLTSLSIARERELGTFDQLIVSPLNSFEILAGKTIPPLIIAIILTCFMTGMAIVLFDVPFVGSFWLFLLSTVVALLSIVGVGLFISSLCKTQQQAILGAFTFQMPAILLSGFISPVEDMPAFFQYLTYLDPIRFYILIAKGLFLKGMSVQDVFANLIPLLFIAALTLFVASRTFKRQLD